MAIERLALLRIAGITTSALLAMSLCGCETVFENKGNVAVSRVGDEVAVAFCGAVQLDKLLVGTAHRSLIPGGFVETGYVASGQASIPKGFILSTGQEVAGLDVELRLDQRLDDANEVTVIGRTDEQDTPISATFEFPTGALPVDAWLRLDGSTTEDPCS